MDFSSLKEQVSNLTLYDIKASVRKVQNVVMNYTEMEAKVREATNNEPWGASSTLMQEIANGTHSYHLLNEIMPMIFRRFTNKTAEEWRQIYKALQLLEFLIKNGSERVVDDAAAQISLIKMLRQFHFIDQNGKDQGINVRNRAKELVELLNDVDRIRAERKKARANRSKYSGSEGRSAISRGSYSSSSRYGGFGNESTYTYGGFSGGSGVYGDGGVFGTNTSEFPGMKSRNRDSFKEYNEYEDTTRSPTSSSVQRHAQSSINTSIPIRKMDVEVNVADNPREDSKAKEVDLFSFVDDPLPNLPSLSLNTSAVGPSTKKVDQTIMANFSGDGVDDDEEFDEFQSAVTTHNTLSQSGNNSLNIANTKIPPPPGVSVNLKPTNSLIDDSRVAVTAAAPALNNSKRDIPNSLDMLSQSSSAFLLEPTNQPFNTSKIPSAPKPFILQDLTCTTTVPSKSVPGSISLSGSTESMTTAVSSTSISSFTNQPVNSSISQASNSSDVFSDLLIGTIFEKSMSNQGKSVRMSEMAKEKASESLWATSVKSNDQSSSSKPGIGNGMSKLKPDNVSASDNHATGSKVNYCPSTIDDLLG